MGSRAVVQCPIDVLAAALASSQFALVDNVGTNAATVLRTSAYKSRPGLMIPVTSRCGDKTEMFSGNSEPPQFPAVS